MDNILSCLLNDQRINCFDGTYSKEQLKKWASKDILLCPACGKPYEYCHGRVVTPYFRHKDKEQCEDRYSEPETEEHIQGKRDLYEWIKQQPDVTDVVLEGWIPGTKQRPDIMFKYSGKQCVIEYQCSPISTEYYERHELYQAAGIIDIWVLGTDKYLQDNMREKTIEKDNIYYYNPFSKKIIINSDNEMFNSFNLIYSKNLFGFTRNYYKYGSRFLGYACDLSNYTFNDSVIANKDLLKLEDSLVIKDKRTKRDELKNKTQTLDSKIINNKLKRLKRSDYLYVRKNNNIILNYCSHRKDNDELCARIYFDKYLDDKTTNLRFDYSMPIYYQVNNLLNESKLLLKQGREKIDKVDRTLYYFSKYNLNHRIRIVFDNKNNNHSFKYKWWFYPDLWYTNITEECFIDKLIDALKFLSKHNLDLTLMTPKSFRVRRNNTEIFSVSDSEYYALIGYLYEKGFRNIEIVKATGGN